MSLLTSIISAVSATRVISNRDQQVSNKLVLLSLTIVLLQLLAGPAAAQFTKLHDFESFFGDSEPVGGRGDLRYKALWHHRARSRILEHPLGS